MDHIKFREMSNQRRFGIELELSNNLSKITIGQILSEFEEKYSYKNQHSIKITAGSQGWSQTNKNDYWHVKYDSTCGPLGKNIDFGWEIASYIANGIDDVNHISKVANYLKENGAQTNYNCGFHIHIETTDYDSRSMGILLATWLKIEHIMLAICHETRRNNMYCQPLLKRCDEIEAKYDSSNPASFWMQIAPTDLGTRDNLDKRFTLNTIGFRIAQLQRLYSRNTVELRLPECKLEDNHLKNWIKLIVNFVDFCVDLQPPENIDPTNSIDSTLFYLGLYDDNNFMICDPELQELWFLEKLSKSNQFLSNQAKRRLEFIKKI